MYPLKSAKLPKSVAEKNFSYRNRKNIAVSMKFGSREGAFLAGVPLFLRAPERDKDQKRMGYALPMVRLARYVAVRQGTDRPR
jgi:hypothetical protein